MTTQGHRTIKPKAHKPNQSSFILSNADFSPSVQDEISFILAMPSPLVPISCLFFGLPAQSLWLNKCISVSHFFCTGHTSYTQSSCCIVMTSHFMNTIFQVNYLLPVVIDLLDVYLTYQAIASWAIEPNMDLNSKRIILHRSTTCEQIVDKQYK